MEHFILHLYGLWEQKCTYTDKCNVAETFTFKYFSVGTQVYSEVLVAFLTVLLIFLIHDV